MDKAWLKTWGRRFIIAGLVLIPFELAAIIAFFVIAGDPLATFALAMPMFALSVCLVGFGAAALNSAKH